MKIANVQAREILDSKGHPTLEAEVCLDNGLSAVAQTPSGASTGINEAFELRDNDKTRYQGKGVLKAIANINTILKPLICGKNTTEQGKIDKLMIETDGTPNKAKFGGNAMVAVSMAVCRLGAKAKKIPLYRYIGELIGNDKFTLPQPQILVLEGGKHGNWSTDVQEYFVIPKQAAFKEFRERLQAGAEIFYSLEKILCSRGYSTGVGYEGAFCPKEISSNEEAFNLMAEAIKLAGFKLPEQVVLGLDAAASEFFKNGNYVLKSEQNMIYSRQEWTKKVIAWAKKYPIWSLEDMHDQNDWLEWSSLAKQLGKENQIIGDDLLTTNVERIKMAIEKKAVNSVLIKPNQIGTVTETLAAIKMSHEAGFTTVISHRGGETNDDFIADLVVGSGSWQCKFGGPDRGERVAKYNRLLKIEEELEK